MSSTSALLPQIWVSDKPFDAYAYSLDVTQAPGEHEVVELEVNSPTRADDYTSIISKRIRFKWGAPADKIDFYGYIIDVTPVLTQQEGQPVNRTRITAYGPTMVLKTGRPRFWSQVKTSEAMASILAEAMLGFSFEMARETVTWRTLAQTTESDWQMLRLLAERIGGYLLHEDGVVRCVDPAWIYARQQPMKFLARGDTPGVTTLLDFIPSSLSVMDPDQQMPVMAYATVGGGAVVKAPPESIGSRLRFSAALPLLHSGEATVVQNAYRNTIWTEQGTARTRGDVGLRPGMNVYVRSQINTSVVNAPHYDGLWYVNTAHHRLDNNVYQAQYDLMRRGGRGSNNQQARPFWFTDKRGRPMLNVNGRDQWMSTWR